MTATTTEKKPAPKPHNNEPIDTRRELRGRTRAGGDAPPEVQQKVVDIIIEEGRALHLSNRDIAYYIAIAKRESGFNPDAASSTTTASGIAQVIDDTGNSFHIDASNRFDARASIKAGLGYFKYLKEKTVADYGSASGEYEAVVYSRYHFGEFSTMRLTEVDVAVKDRKAKNGVVGTHTEKKMRERPRPFEEVKASAHYKDSVSVVDEAIRIEKILNDAHGLQVQLTDITGKPMGKRTVMVLTKTPKPGPAAVAPPAPKPAPAPTPAAAVPTEPAAVPAAPPADASATAAPAADAGKADDNAAPADADKSVPGAAQDAAPKGAAACGPAPELHIEWVLNVSVFETDDDGNLPQIETPHATPVMILIPRPDYEAYNEAVEKRMICESGNEHDILPRDGEQVLAAVPETPAEKAVAPAAPAPAPAPAPAAAKHEQAKASAPPSAAKPKAEAAKTGAPQNVFDSASKGAASASQPSPQKDITFNDVTIAFTQNLGWKTVYATTFSYIKQFYTRPRLPEAPLDNTVATKKSDPRLQVIQSSLTNKDVKATAIKDKVTTATQTAVTPVAVTGDPAWMTVALAEQTKAPKMVDKRPRDDATWREEKKKRDAAIESIASLKAQLRAEQKKKTADPKRIAEIKALTAEQEDIRDKADKAMQDIESQYNNADIIKYLNSTTLKGGEMARDDATAWCSSFANWCMEQAGYKGTDNAMADSWVNWGEEIAEARYGAVTVVKRGEYMDKKKGLVTLYHVGFYTGIVEKKVQTGTEEVEVKGKKVKKPVFTKVKYVRLLSGNMSNTVRELSEWTLDPADDPLQHFVSYRWPTAKEKR
jgi:uncharacterized protein (TIGR02594 family)